MACGSDEMRLMAELMATLRDGTIHEAEVLRAKSRRADTPDGAAPLTEPTVSDAVLQWREGIDREYTHINETSAILRKLRADRIHELQEAIALLEEEQRCRKLRCNALSTEIGKIEDQKVKLMLRATDAVDFGSRGSQGPTTDAASEKLSKEAGSKGERGAGSSKSRTKRKPLNPMVGAGALTKRQVEEHFASYWAEKAKARSSQHEFV